MWKWIILASLSFGMVTATIMYRNTESGQVHEIVQAAQTCNPSDREHCNMRLANCTSTLTPGTSDYKEKFDECWESHARCLMLNGC